MKRSYWPTKEWQAAEPSVLQMDAEQLAKLNGVVSADYGNIGGIVLVKNGYVAFENYYNGHRPEDALHVASATKSVLSALIGIAISEGAIKSIDAKVLDFFPEYIPNPVDGLKREITLRHLLTMTAPYPFEDWHEPLDRLTMREDWVSFALDMLGQGGHLGTFKYSTAGAHLLSAILTKATGKSAREYANEKLFGPLGMKILPDYPIIYGFDGLFGKDVRGWVHDPAGISAGGWGLTLTPRDMARFGFLYLNRGKWDGRQIVPEQWIEESMAMNPNHYGYLWWLREENGVFAFMAMGDGGNTICCIPEKDMVVAIASDFIPNPKDRWVLIRDHILPAVREKG